MVQDDSDQSEWVERVPIVSGERDSHDRKRRKSADLVLDPRIESHRLPWSFGFRFAIRFSALSKFFTSSLAPTLRAASMKR
jgi:hypothetical protein